MTGNRWKHDFKGVQPKMMLTVLLLSLIGYSMFVSNWKKIPFAFSVPLSVSAIMLVTFLGGIFRILPLMPRILCGLGIILLICVLLQMVTKKTAINDPLSIAFQLLIWCGGVIFLYFQFTSSTFFLTHYDNFSHWGIVARQIIVSNHFPTAAEADVISFRAYPTGSAAWIYYCSKVLQCSDTGILLFGQAVAVFSFYFSLLGCVKSKNRIVFLLESAAGGILAIALCNYNITLNHLLVDNLVAGIMMFALLFIISLHDQMTRYYLELCLIVSACIIVKTSGMILLTLSLYAVFCLYEEYAGKEHLYFQKRIKRLISNQPVDSGIAEPVFPIVPCISLIAVPLLIFVLWKIHCHFTFSMLGISGGKHSGSLSGLLTTMGSGKERFEKAAIILPKFFGLTSNRGWVMILWMAGLVIGKLVAGDNLRENYLLHRKSVSVLTITLILYIVYEISLFAMYMFSMTLSEMIRQNGRDYFRYNSTIVAVFIGAVFYMIVYEHEQAKSSAYLKWGVTATGIIVLAFAFNFHFPSCPDMTRLKRQYPDLYQMELVMETDMIDEEDCVLVYYSKKYGIPSNGANYYLYPCTKYEVVTDKDKFKSLKSNHSYSVIIDLPAGTLVKGTYKYKINELIP